MADETDLYARTIRTNSRYFSPARFRDWCRDTVGTRAAAATIAREAEISESYVYHLWSGSRGSSVEAYCKICAAFGLPFDALVDHVVYLPQPDETRLRVARLAAAERYFDHRAFDAWCVEISPSGSGPVLARHLGVDVRSVYRLARGHQRPTLEMYLRMCARTQTPVSAWLRSLYKTPTDCPDLVGESARGR